MLGKYRALTALWEQAEKMNKKREYTSENDWPTLQLLLNHFYKEWIHCGLLNWSWTDD